MTREQAIERVVRRVYSDEWALENFGMRPMPLRRVTDLADRYGAKRAEAVLTYTVKAIRAEFARLTS